MRLPTNAGAWPGPGPYGGAIDELTYPEIGATAGALPPGYRHLTRERRLGTGEACFESAVERLMSWQMHRRAGVSVDAPAAREDMTVMLSVHLGLLKLAAPVRVIEVVTDPWTRGFAYGTLPGHPESGEERFLVHRDPDGTVRATIRAFSRPARWYARLGGPITERLQDNFTERYLDALS